MRTTSALYFGMVAVGIAVLLAASPARLSAQQNPAEAVRIGDNDLGGVVTSAQGPEAGVWVIADRRKNEFPGTGPQGNGLAEA